MNEQWHNTSPHRTQWAHVTYQRWRTTPTWAQRLLGALVLILLLGLGTVLLLSGLVVGAIAAGVIALIWGVGWIANRVRTAIGSAPHSSRGPSGAAFRDKGRENVRVIGPTQRH